MRTDETGQPCPGTLFEYRDLCKAIGGTNCKAVKFLEERIAKNGGQDDEVIQADSQMRLLLMPMLFESEPRTPARVEEMAANGLLNAEVPPEVSSAMAQTIADEVDAKYVQELVPADVCMGCSTDRINGACPNPECTWGKNKETD